MRILVVALSGIGDAIMFTPALIKLKEEFPDSEIDALVMFNGVKDIYRNITQISEIIFWDFLNKSKFASLSFALGLRNKYDITINVYPSNRKEYNLISRLIGSKKRCAVEYLRMDFKNLGFLNNIRVRENDSLHNVEENIRMIEKLSGKKAEHIPPLQLPFSNIDLTFANRLFNEKEIQNNDLIIGFHPGCATLKNHDKRRWEPEKFAELGSRLINEHFAKILIFGGPEENILKDSINDIINSPKSITVNTNSLIQTAAVMKRCDIFVTNDSSLMHVAAAMQLNVIAIIGPTNPNYIHPWHTKHKIISLNLECAPCFFYSPKPLTCTRTDTKFKCVKELSVNLVYNEVSAQINNLRKLLKI